MSIATRLWLTGTLTAEDASLEGLIKNRIGGRLEQRKLFRVLDEAADLVAERVITSTGQVFPSLTQQEKDLVAESVADMLDLALMQGKPIGNNVDLVTIERHVRAVSDRIGNIDALSGEGVDFREYLIREACAYAASMAKALPSFRAEVFSELLQRNAQILDQLQQILDKLPRRAGEISDTFELDYRRMVSLRLDRMELFGVTIDEASRSYPLTTAYIALTANCDGRSNRVHDVLSQTQRLLLLGGAGAGKSTFLRWIGVSAARRSFPDNLSHWNSFVPFFIPLRQFAGIELPGPAEFVASMGGFMSEVIPDGWVENVLASGKAFVLIDGVDELPVEQRQETSRWLSELVESFPYAWYVVTSRPAGVHSNWLQRVGFKNATLEPMLHSDMESFIAAWHQAAAMERGTDSKLYDFNPYQRQLLNLISVNRDLRELAANPLMCALLCALNLRSGAHLPVDRVDLYDMAINMLLERRDAERGITTYRVPLSRAESRLILQSLAYWLMLNDITYTSRTQAIKYIRLLVNTFPRSNVRPDAVLQDLLERSGLLYEASADEISFIHRSFQEYLAAAEAVSRDDIGFLVTSAMTERYRNVVLLASGLASVMQRKRLIGGILRRGDEHAEFRRYLVLLALDCAGNAPMLDPETAEAVRSRALEVLPPRSKTEADMVADAGPFAVALVRATTGALSVSYKAGALSAEQLQAEIDRFWREVQTSDELAAEITTAGFNREALTRAQESPIIVSAQASGMDPSSTLLTVTFAPYASGVLKHVWDTILLPRIQQQWGNDAIGTRSRADL